MDHRRTRTDLAASAQHPRPTPSHLASRQVEWAGRLRQEAALIAAGVFIPVTMPASGPAERRRAACVN